MLKVGFISLGCSKNLVDTEIMMADLVSAGHLIVNQARDADIVVVNTCGFIDDAKKEAIEALLEIGLMKKEGWPGILIASGCLAQRYPDELLKEIPELDGVIGVAALHDLNRVIARCLRGERVRLVPDWPVFYSETGERVVATPPGWAYLKIAEGCDNRCSYCAIPSIRGPLRSRPWPELLREATKLVMVQGIRELVLVAQDTTAYGLDRKGRGELPFLLEKLAQIPGLDWIRVMYAYPNRVDEALIEAFQIPQVVAYLDMPVQHGSDRILRHMGRRYNHREVLELVERLRNKVPGIALRTTFICGFPGEEEADHRQSLQLLREAEFDWTGAFTYSEEEGTPACQFGDKVEAAVKEERRHELMTLSQEITARHHRLRVGQKTAVLVQGVTGPGQYWGRTYFQAPEVDGFIVFPSDQKLKPGDLLDVRLESNMTILLGEDDGIT